jgi:glycosyltransferase involved in cell wall biosynthesis
MNKLTFGISCYNFGNYIEKCLTSVLSQKTDFEFDVVVRDDFSTDNSREILTEIKNSYTGPIKITLLFGEANVGTHENISRLLSSCTGEYVSLLDGDDFITDNNKLQKQVEFLDQNRDFVLHCTSWRCIDKNGNYSPEEGSWFTPVHEVVTLEDILNVNYITFGRLFRNIKAISESISSDNYYKTFPYDDWGLNFEILKHGKAMCDSSWVSGVYRITGSGVITSNTPQEIESKNNKCREILDYEYRRFKKIDI